MPPGPKDTSRLGCAHVGGDKETSRGSVDWVDALTAYGKKTRFGLARNKIRSECGVWRSAFGVAGFGSPLDLSPLTTHPRAAPAAHLSSVHPHDALGDSGEDFPSDCACLRRQFSGQDLLVALASYEDYLLAWCDPFQVAHVDHDLVHGYPA